MCVPDTDTLAAVLNARHACLRALIDRPQAKRDLVETLEIPRSTLDDIVRELEDAGLVEYRDGTWSPTHIGRLAHRAHREYLERLECLIDVAPVLGELDPESEIGWAVIDGADVHETHPHVPDAVMPTVLDHVEAATTVRIVTPRLVAGYGDELYRRGVAGQNASIELIVPPAVDDWIRSEHSVVATELFDDPAVDAFRASIPFSVGIWMFDDVRAGVTVFTERGIAGLIVTDTPAALTWAEQRYESVKQAAEPVSLPDEAL
ncbi:hypothetical protein C478_14772 [Natrinema thermotolerans DSM 11552]|nr:hypothetical protein C478_14772 [Natrinema thermotolerans DSM 11552]